MVFEKIVFTSSGTILASDHNTLQDRYQAEIWRVDQAQPTEIRFIRNSDGYIISGIEVSGGSEWSTRYIRDTNNFILSGIELREDKTITTRLVRDANNLIISGIRTVT